MEYVDLEVLNLAFYLILHANTLLPPIHSMKLWFVVKSICQIVLQWFIHKYYSEMSHVKWFDYLCFSYKHFFPGVNSCLGLCFFICFYLPMLDCSVSSMNLYDFRLELAKRETCTDFKGRDEALSTSFQRSFYASNCDGQTQGCPARAGWVALLCVLSSSSSSNSDFRSTIRCGIDTEVRTFHRSLHKLPLWGTHFSG